MRVCVGLLTVVVSLLALAVGLVSAASGQPASWEASFGGTHIEKGYSVQQTVDGGYILLGVTLSKGAGQTDFWLIKTNSAGEMEWDQTFGGMMDDWGRGIKQTRDGGYILYWLQIHGQRATRPPTLVDKDRLQRQLKSKAQSS